MITKVCRDCKLEKPLTELTPDKRSSYGYKALCKTCVAIRMRKQRAKPESKHLQQRRDWRKRQRQSIINALGGKCAICGESHYEHLVIDHINDDGNIHRAAIKGNNKEAGERVYQDIIKQGIPKDKFQVLCANCNMAKHNSPILRARAIQAAIEGLDGEGI